MFKFGIIGAMPEETERLKKEIEDIEEKSTPVRVVAGSLEFLEGSLAGKPVVLAQCGIGKVNAAIVASLLISRFQVNAVLFTGVAGALDPSLDIGDIVIGDELLEHDFDVTAFGKKPGEIPGMDTSRFPCDPRLVEMAEKSAIKLFTDIKIVRGRILSGDVFIASPEKIRRLRSQFGGMCTEMEGAAVAHVCHVLHTPCLVIRAVSDKADGDANADFKKFVDSSAERSARLLRALVQNYA
ncbi:MAG: 5'-methylthioadenosine/adenosylhomocysteine nucleosidase [Fusobacteriaceae bacterium]|jgi:adenosylhomocysteine nucleosidase|nr:5'-methylthioadenosine/adenosylhomocysteine nucleosidase [Fusobacteriaceae bacterium]